MKLNEIVIDDNSDLLHFERIKNQRCHEFSLFVQHLDTQKLSLSVCANLDIALRDLSVASCTSMLVQYLSPTNEQLSNLWKTPQVLMKYKNKYNRMVTAKQAFEGRKQRLQAEKKYESY